MYNNDNENKLYTNSRGVDWMYQRPLITYVDNYGNEKGVYWEHNVERLDRKDLRKMPIKGMKGEHSPAAYDILRFIREYRFTMFKMKIRPHYIYIFDQSCKKEILDKYYGQTVCSFEAGLTENKIISLIVENLYLAHQKVSDMLSCHYQFLSIIERFHEHVSYVHHCENPFDENTIYTEIRNPTEYTINKAIEEEQKLTNGFKVSCMDREIEPNFLYVVKFHYNKSIDDKDELFKCKTVSKQMLGSWIIEQTFNPTEGWVFSPSDDDGVIEAVRFLEYKNHVSGCELWGEYYDLDGTVKRWLDKQAEQEEADRRYKEFLWSPLGLLFHIVGLIITFVISAPFFLILALLFIITLGSGLLLGLEDLAYLFGGIL